MSSKGWRITRGAWMWASALFRRSAKPQFRCQYSSTWKRKVKKQEFTENTVFQYVGKNTARADRVYVWGYAATGALGVKRFLRPENKQRLRPRQLCPHRQDFFDEHSIKPYNIGCGYGFTVFLARTSHGSRVYGTGINTDSQLGYQEYPPKSGRILDYVIEPVPIELPLEEPQSTKPILVSCGRAHAIVVTDKEGVFSLGNNCYGQCGYPVVKDEAYRGSQTIHKVQLDAKIAQVICGQDHSLFLTEDGQIFSCGLGSDGQTGLGHFNCVAEPQLVTGDISGEKIVSVSTKADCVLAVSDKGDIFGWGNSEYDQLSSVSMDETQVCAARRLPFQDVGKVVKVAAAGSMCALLNDKGQVFVWGFGILGKGPRLQQCAEPQLIPEMLLGQNEFNPDQRVVELSCGITHFAAVTSSGELYTWGHNKTACLGLGNLLDQPYPFKVQVPAEVKQVYCGVDHMVVLCKSFV